MGGEDGGVGVAGREAEGGLGEEGGRNVTVNKVVQGLCPQCLVDLNLPRSPS